MTRYSSGEDSDATDNNRLGSSKVAKKPARITVSGSASGQKMTPPPPLFNSYSQPATLSRSTSYNSRNLSSGSGRNVYVSPVIINDSEDDDLDWSMRRSGRSNNSSSNLNNNSSSSKTPQSRSINLNRTFDSYNNSNNNNQSNGSNGYDNNEDEEEDTNTTSDYTKRLLQLREGVIQKNNQQQQQQNNLRKRSTYLTQTQRTSSDYQGIQ